MKVERRRRRPDRPPHPGGRLRRARQAAPEPPRRRLGAGRLRDGRRRNVAGGRAWSAPSLGTALVAGGASAYNQVLERDTDALMQRTRSRPLPDGRLQVGRGADLRHRALVAGPGDAGRRRQRPAARSSRSPRSSATSSSTRRSSALTSFATVIGAIPGALPPMIGWAAAREELARAAWLLFGIMFLWQLPHFLRDRVDVSARTTRAPGSRCCRSSSRTAAAPGGRRSSTPRRSCRSASRRRYRADRPRLLRRRARARPPSS